jgi:prepilin-type N-terminal cleavage/methylation domain-containing protein
MTRRTQQPRRPRHGGFTLIELILVMLLLTIIVGTAVPSVKGYLGWSRSRDSISLVVSLTQYARSKSAADAKAYKLCADGTTCWLEVQLGENFQRVTDELGEPVIVPEGASVEFMPGANRNAPAVNVASTDAAALSANDGIVFYPDGRVSSGLIRYTSPAGVQSYLASPSPAESFRVMPPQEAQRL